MNKKGYTIAEFVFALMILTVFLLLNISLYSNSLKNVKESERLVQAINLAITKTEQLQNTDYSLVESESEYEPYVDNTNYKLSVDVVEDSKQVAIGEDTYRVFKEITVNVTYIVAGKEDAITLKSLKVNNNLVDQIYGENTI